MSAEDNVLVMQITERLRTISPNDLQILAEEMAILACPARFKGRPLIRQGRNGEGQTTKGWPDAYVLTSPGIVDGIEATREGQSWSKHLNEDLKKASDNKNFNLSGYFFVASYPDHEPSAAEIKEWSEKFVSAGILAENIQLMIGKHLALELARPEYAQIRQSLLGLASSSIYFERIRDNMLLKRSSSLAQPTEFEFRSGKVFEPSVTSSVLDKLKGEGICLVRGHGACGKTTLAYWIGLSDSYHPAPVYYIDLTDLPIDATIGVIKNELVELNGPGVLFVIDNIHINENWAEVLLNHWRQYCKKSGSHLLLLGRETGAKEGTSLGNVAPIIMRAGKKEFRQLVKLRCGDDVKLTELILDQWLEIFGGRRGLSRGNSMVVVDLIAFGAALEQRKAYIKAGNLNLSCSDAVAAVRERYLQPISDPQVLENLCRLAAVSEFELRVPRTALKHPAAGLENDCITKGLVLSHGDRFALAHAALGPLLLEAAPQWDIQSERILIAKEFPYLGLGMVRAGMEHDEREILIDVISETLKSGSWLKYCSNLHDVSGIAISAIRTLKFDHAILDAVIGGNRSLKKLILKTRSLETLTSTAARLKSVGLTRTADIILEPSDSQSLTVLLGNITSARSGEVLGFLKSLSRSKCIELLDKINTENWITSRSVVAIDYASTTCQLCRHLESVGRKDLAASPALELIKRFDLSHLFRSDLGDISNLIRLGSPEDNALESFIGHLIDTGWLSHAYLETRSGQLCGALMSFANTMPTHLTGMLIIPAATSRIESEALKLQKLLMSTEEEYNCDYWPKTSQEKKLPFDVAKNRSVARFVCILGAGYALWGPSFPIIQWTWPEHATIEDVYFSRSPSDSESYKLGMYELQYWLGLRFLTHIKTNLPSITDEKLIDSFVKRLQMTPAPTARGSVLRNSLLKWLSGDPACVLLT
ncbi:hypothetical protein LOY57_03090 [Pseudomonas moraviensis]|uniref:hypothetical protein n=1 Tax=Pseudomonas moraviensis TaxID=321662 RepID=UPI00215DE19F|nr:hypothetical protein [Pseudomonas moraviensis]UVL46805.1 hypothetical protein LOY57_03090 [Pseudomonas moraviensis]